MIHSSCRALIALTLTLAIPLLGLAASDNPSVDVTGATSAMRPLHVSSSSSADSAAKLMEPRNVSVQPQAVQQGFDSCFLS
jgi:hypothetical protein